jgi:amino acid permease
VRWDAAVAFGLTEIDPSFGFTAGMTYVFNAFTVP